MSTKIYEYKDDEDWYLAKCDVESLNITSFEGDVKDNAMKVLHSLSFLGDLNLSVHIVSYSSDLKFLTFLLDIINTVYTRSVTMTQHQGLILISENGTLYSVLTPKEGVSVDTILGNHLKHQLGDSILIATHNEGKVKEFRRMFQKIGISVESLNDYPELPEVEETGVTFEENARLKAETIASLTGQMVLADDSGLKVDILGGMPGVWSARFSGPDATDEKNNLKLLHELAMVFELKDRKAQFHTCLVVAAPHRESLVVEADWEGYIGFDAKGSNGFGYDPLFLVGETGRTSAELTADEKNKISHRGQAVKKLMEVFPSWQQKQSL